jgi:hypothetical protein
MLLSQIILYVLLTHWGMMIATGYGRVPVRHIVMLAVAVILQCLATYLMRSKTVWWQSVLWALAMASGVVSLSVFFAAFPFSWHLLIPAAISFAIFIVSVAALTYLQEKYVK